MLPPMMFMVDAAAPPPKNRVTTRVAKFGAKADGKRHITWIAYPKPYAGVRPHDSDSGTKTGGKTAAPIWNDIVTHCMFGKGLFLT